MWLDKIMEEVESDKHDFIAIAGIMKQYLLSSNDPELIESAKELIDIDFGAEIYLSTHLKHTL